MFRLAEEADLSPEKLGKTLGVSGMTLRRWRKSAKDEPLPPLYERAFMKGIEQMVVEGRIDPSSRLARETDDGRALSFQAALKGLGFSEAVMSRKGNPNDAMIEGLSQIASSSERMKEVDAGKKKIFSFAKMGEEWRSRIQGMWNVVTSAQLTTMDKLVAYGALFYLLTPFDLIPDNIPVVGLLDDYAILGLAIAYYMKRYPSIVSAQKKK